MKIYAKYLRRHCKNNRQLAFRKSIILRFVQLLKAMSAIDLTLVPMVSFWIHVVPENTLAAISALPLFSALVVLGNTTLVHLLRLSLNENLVSWMLSGKTSSPSVLLLLVIHFDK